MSYTNGQNEFPLPAGQFKKRASSELLPRYFRTIANEKFLSSTLDQLVQPGVAEKVTGYYGRKTAKSYKPGDNYVDEVSHQRKYNQLEPGVVIKDDLNNVNFYKSYTDYINQIAAFGGNVDDQSILNAQEYYAWNPNIDFDKFTNFREYYWLPHGPQTVVVYGQSKEISSTYSVTTRNNGNNTTYVFSPDGQTSNPNLSLYRGQTYRFDINTTGFPIAISANSFYTPRPIERVADDGSIVYGEATNTSNLYTDGVTTSNGEDFVENGWIEITIPDNAPDELFYVSRNDANLGGLILVKNIEENSKINVETEILGKRAYTAANGVKFTNGLKVRFGGDVLPEEYADTEWYVEGVGSSITLVHEHFLNIITTYTEETHIPFDSEGFDRMPFSNASAYAKIKDYIVCNRGSNDRNAWSRYNKWFHRDVIEASATANGLIPEFDQASRAKRPILEFAAGLKLYNFGTSAKHDVNLVDTYTTDVFSTIEGSTGYNIDGIDITDNMRILFTADTDPLVSGRIYKVKFITIGDRRQIALIPDSDANDSEPLENETVLVTQGTDYAGAIFYYNGTTWNLGQTKTKVNQQPLFDLFDEEGISYTDESKYDATSFRGNPILSYDVGTGDNDAELNFPIVYRSVQNVGDIQFTFNLSSDTISYQLGNDLITVESDIGFLRRYKERDQFEYLNGWVVADELSKQYVVQQTDIEIDTTEVPVICYDKSGLVDDLYIDVYVDHKTQFIDKDYTVKVVNDIAIVEFTSTLSAGSVVILKTRSKQIPNEHGYYEFPHNMERNPNNEHVHNFTLGEVNDHVEAIIEEIPGIDGQFPGRSNLRDLGDITKYGRRFVKHSGPIDLALYHLTDKNANIIKALRFAKLEYGKFKRNFIQVANSLGYHGEPKKHVDLILEHMNKDKTSSMPFYFSDMVPIKYGKSTEHIADNSTNNFYGLSATFNLDAINHQAVLVYRNDELLVFGRDYTFTDDGFVELYVDTINGDKIHIYEYESTDGSFVPPTPTKLGLYPKYVPEKFLDTSYLEPVNVIRGHDGSITVAYDDFRDELLLELEKRIFNNIKQTYNDEILDIHYFLDGEYRDTNYTRDKIDSSMISDFIDWVRLAGNPDYTDYSFYNRDNSFTYNYSEMTSPFGNALPGGWRGVYMHAYDTDRPDVRPWEMLDFSIKPDWWEDQYGPAPYTSNNLVMWEDIEAGVIREPGKEPRQKSRYKRPGLTSHLPVDEFGNLVSPLDSGFARGFVERNTRKPFKFGDVAPVEAAWRKSPEYPFAVILSWILNQPAHIFGVGYDLSRIHRNLSGQLVYSTTQGQINTRDIQFPNTVIDNERISTSGLVNYVYNYLASDIVASYDKYKDDLFRLSTQISLKVGSFTEKSKFKLILDSRTPFNEGNVFVPSENYQIFLNTSSPVSVPTYSAVVVEKVDGGYVVRGYDNTDTTFNYFKPIPTQSDAVINIGGISESYVTWTANKTYGIGQNVAYGSNYYRCKETHTSEESFDSTKFNKLPALPQVGGRSAVIRTTYEETPTNITYGTMFTKQQDVVDFLFGYGRYLESLGFKFDLFNGDIGLVEDWYMSVKEFLFWTTQNWAIGTAISLSPGANKLSFKSSYAVVDDIFNNFYDYSLYKSSGKTMAPQNVRVSRINNTEFSISPVNTSEGVYFLKLPLVQKEHVVLIDNSTVYKDIIYQPSTGYRQERIKVVGYRSDNWDGGLNIPGFVYDSAVITEWTSWKDYTIGSLVKYKEFYYVAIEDISGADTFDPFQWERLSEKPESKLIPNFDYRVNQFADFYDLDTDNFDAEQQRLAQHLIGYQKRQYLQNIVNDDVSQYKFYQGMIQDKGTRNSIDKLFQALSSADKESIEFYEEWAIRSGRYGAVDNYAEVDYTLDESQFRLSPQPVELVQTIDYESTDLTFKIRPFQTYSAPLEYNHRPFPTIETEDRFLKSAGYVRDDDITYRVATKDELLDVDVSLINAGDYVWVLGIDSDWDVLQLQTSEVRVTGFEPYSPTTEELSADQVPNALITLSDHATAKPGDIVGVYDTSGSDYFYKVVSTSLNTIKVYASENTIVTEEESPVNGFLTIFKSVRFASFSSVNDLTNRVENQLAWIDNGTDWKVIENNVAYTPAQELINPTLVDIDVETGYGNIISVSAENTVVAVNSEDSNKVYVYTRASESNRLRFQQEITVDDIDFSSDSLQDFGKSVAVSPDGKLLVIGSPNASNIPTNFVGNFDVAGTYETGDVVRYDESLWSALRPVFPEEVAVAFNSFYGYLEIANPSVNTPLLLIGNPYHQGYNSANTHILVRPNTQMFQGSKPGDKVYLEWNEFSTLHGDRNSHLPFNGEYDVAGYDMQSEINGMHVIEAKVDNVLYFETYSTTIRPGDVITTPSAQAEVYYSLTFNDSLILYINNVSGVISETDTAYLGTDVIGTYVDNNHTQSSDLSGFWFFSLSPSYPVEVTDVYSDLGKGLVIRDYLLETETRDALLYENIFTTVVGAPTGTVSSFIANLSYKGDNGNTPDYQEFLDSRFVVRVPPTNTLEVGSPFTLWLNEDDLTAEISATNIPVSVLESVHTVADIWDGYVDVTFTEFDVITGLPYELEVGDIIKDELTQGQAEVMHVQRQTSVFRAYLKNVVGRFRTGDPTLRIRAGEVTRGLGPVSTVSLVGTSVGKMLVVDQGSGNEFTFPVGQAVQSIIGNENALINKEYWLYNSTSVSGIARSPGIPSDTNRDWYQVYNIPVNVDNGTPSDYTGQGMFSVFERQSTGDFVFRESYTTPYTGNNTHFGSLVKMSQNGKLYRLYAGSQGNDTTGNEGKIDFIKYGTDEIGNTYNWALGIEPEYRGEYDNTLFYSIGQVVSYQNVLYKAITNVASKTGTEIELAYWQPITSGIDYLGYLPNNSGSTFYGEEIFNPEDDVIQFGQKFDVTRDGKTLIVVATLENPGVSNGISVLVYYLYNDKYTLAQEITAPTSGQGFATSISINDDGEYLAISEPYNDNTKADQGIVYVYQRNADNVYELTQTVVATDNETTEKFGYNISLNGSQLVVASLNGNTPLITTIDSGDTYFDNKFTTFVKEQRDSGSVVIYENVNGVYVYAEKLKYENIADGVFGHNAAVMNNHVYVVSPRMRNENVEFNDVIGAVVDFRKSNGSFAWNIKREKLPVVDPKKIKNVLLYNKNSSELVTYLDFVDPHQGKILGVAEQELSYKTFYDPAMYNVGNIAELYSETESWDSRYVGKLWWNLDAVRFFDAYQGDSVFQGNTWNKVLPGTAVEVYEWVESDYLPDDWDTLADTESGIEQGISGTTRYGNALYTQRIVYDVASKTYSSKYYFWVKDKKTIPNVENRNLSSEDVTTLIADPYTANVSFVACSSDNRFVLYNCEQFVDGTDYAISFRYYTKENQKQNVHTQYSLFTQGLADSTIPAEIEKQIINSLVGFDENSRRVPDIDLPEKQRYGIERRPRQGLFINRTEALKQVIEHCNIAFKSKIIVDDFDLSGLNTFDPPPLAVDRGYDLSIETYSDLQFVGTSRIKKPNIVLTVEDGAIVRVIILDGGQGYKVVPTYTINGIGSGAIINFTINSIGEITDAEIVNGGAGYNENTTITIRPITVLIDSDETINNKWSVYEWNIDIEDWVRTQVQDFDTRLYWDYVDWFATGYNQFTYVNHVIDYSYELAGLTVNIGDIVKIKSIGTGGWLLLKRIDNQETIDYSVNYETVGRESGTIKIKDTIYDLAANAVGYDSFRYDGKFYDTQPIKETRAILTTIAHDIFVDDLAIEYNSLVYMIIRYVMAEQNNVDWVFKTSFIKAKHNVGELAQTINFKNDSLPSFSDYINEVKPYKTQVREYVSAYEKVDDTNSVVTDFDVPPKYNFEYNKILPKEAKFKDGAITRLDSDFETYPYKHWLDNIGYKVIDIEISDSGSGYLTTPVVTILGDARVSATAKAYLGAGKVTHISVLTTGDGYLTTPTVVIEGGLSTTGTPAKASAIVGEGTVRSTNVKVKFDRVSGEYYIDTLDVTEEFTGTGNRLNFGLKWPTTLKMTEVSVLLDNVELLRSEFSIDNVKDTTKGYTRYTGILKFNEPPANEANIVINYKKSVELLSAEDRVNYFYNPTEGMLGNYLGQVMTGVDYGGVEVKSFEFAGSAGWDTDEWYTTTWDSYDNTYDDEVIGLDISTIAVELSRPLELGVIYNVYLNGVRLDDPNYSAGTQTNPNAIMDSIVGDNVTSIINITEIIPEPKDDDVLIIRKITSDGSFLPDETSFDTVISGGDLQYSTATGLAAEDIIIDGDGFVTPTTSGKTEELVPGQVLDTMYMTVYERFGEGQGVIYHQNIITDGVTETYPLYVHPSSTDAILLKLNDELVSEDDYTFDLVLDTVIFTNIPEANQKLSISIVTVGSSQVVDLGKRVIGTTTSIVETYAHYSDYGSHFVTINGQLVDATIFETTEENSRVGYVGIEFSEPLNVNDVVYYGVYKDSEDAGFSMVTRDNFIGDGSTQAFTLSKAPGTTTPIEFFTMVQVGSKLLAPGFSQEFVISNQREYQIDLTQYPGFSISAENLEVYINGIRKVQGRDFYLDFPQSILNLYNGIGENGDIMQLYIVNVGEYTIDGDIITFTEAPAEDSQIVIWQFTDHSIAEIDRTRFELARRTLTPGTESYAKYLSLNAGTIELRSPADSEQFVWLSKNGDLLTPNVDYRLSLDKMRIKLVDNLRIDDVIDVIHFAGIPARQVFAFSQFKDILNRTHFKRVDDDGIRLAADLNWYDPRIEVNDASTLPNPDPQQNRPGIIFINGERIEYFVKDGNLLRQIRRGTLGTGVKEVHTANSRVFNNSSSKNIPYKDATFSQTFIADGLSNSFELDFVPSSVNDFEVFVAGRRLRKVEIQSYDQNLNLDSPEGDITLPVEFTVAGASLILTDTPLENQKIFVIRKQGKAWTNNGETLRYSNTAITQFLHAGVGAQPE